MSAKDEGDYRCTVTGDENSAFANAYVRTWEDSADPDVTAAITGTLAAFIVILAIITIAFLRRNRQKKRVRNVANLILYYLVHS